MEKLFDSMFLKKLFYAHIYVYAPWKSVLCHRITEIESSFAKLFVEKYIILPALQVMLAQPAFTCSTLTWNNAWCPLKVHAYLNKPTTESCRFV